MIYIYWNIIFPFLTVASLGCKALSEKVLFSLRVVFSL